MVKVYDEYMNPNDRRLFDILTRTDEPVTRDEIILKMWGIDKESRNFESYKKRFTATVMRFRNRNTQYKLECVRSGIESLYTLKDNLDG